MLTGLLPPDHGEATARAYGIDLLTRDNEGTAPLGVVPQHDVLWEELTVREHAHFCAVLKSGGYEACAAADDLLRTFHLDDRLAHFGSELSGGMRRKLSTVCALAGGSKFVVLDEPTTGLDPLARRELWDVLAREKSGRCLLLTTHYMDEADTIGDRVAPSPATHAIFRLLKAGESVFQTVLLTKTLVHAYRVAQPLFHALFWRQNTV